MTAAMAMSWAATVESLQVVAVVESGATLIRVLVTVVCAHTAFFALNTLPTIGIRRGDRSVRVKGDIAVMLVHTIGELERQRRGGREEQSDESKTSKKHACG